MSIVFRLDLPHGHCVGVEIPTEGAVSGGAVVDEMARAMLLEEEQATAARLTAHRRAAWVAGRVALRTALSDLGITAGPLLSTPRGAPALPAAALGSISHKHSLAVALAAPHPGGGVALGVDLELDAPLRVDISRRVLTPAELAVMDGLDPAPRNRMVLLHLSAKESIYKALDPFVARYVSFQEAELAIHPDGTAPTTLTLRNGEGPFTVEARWRALPDDLLLTSAKITRGS
jgi:4'-phosphopantetheinyl transferase EntD